MSRQEPPRESASYRSAGSESAPVLPARPRTPERFDDPDSIFSARRAPLNYTAEQLQALQAVDQLIRAKQCGVRDHSEVVIAGYAGTGKTTIAENFITHAQNCGLRVLVMAPTNKAVTVLTGKLPHLLNRNNARSIHSVLYGAPDERGDFKIGRPSTLGLAAEVVLVDEASMIPKNILDDIRRSAAIMDTKLIFLGDGFQLPPVERQSQRGQHAETFLANPDVELTEVRRQAEGSAILELATLLRTEKRVIVPCGRYGEIEIFDRNPAELFASLYEQHGGDVVYLVGKNSTRVIANAAIRNQLYGVDRAKTEKLLVGESLLAISNNAHYSNGSLLRVAEIRNDLGTGILTRAVTTGPEIPHREYYYRYEVVDDEGREFRLFLFPATQSPSIHNRDIPELNRQIRGKSRTDNSVVVATYGNALSVHKSQGGQWKAVMLYPEFPFADDPRWLYTGVTRAQSALHLNIENIKTERRVLPQTIKRLSSNLISPAD